MFDLGMTELLVIGVTALIVVGPKDLPVLFRRAGEFVGKLRGMAREFSSAMNDAASESGMNEMASDLRTIANPASSAFDAVKDAAADATKLPTFDPDSETGKLSAERAAAAKKIQAKSARAAAERMEKEAKAAAEKAAALEAEATALDAPAKPAKKAAPKKKALAKTTTAKKKAAPKKAASK